MFQLYESHMSVCSGKARLILEEKGQTYEEIAIDLQKGESHTPEYMKLNPKGVVPTLIHDGLVVCESTVIMQYLDDIFADPPLVPDDPLARIKMRMWMKMVDEDVHPATAVVTYAIALRHEAGAKNSPEELEARFTRILDPVKRARNRALHYEGVESEAFGPAIKVMEKMLKGIEADLEGGGDWLLGDAYSLADAAVTPYVLRLEMLGFDDMLADGRPRLPDWWARIKSRPNYRGAISPATPAAAAEGRRKWGSEAWPRVKELLAA